MDLDNEVYPGGFYKLMRVKQRKETPFVNADLVLPADDVDLAALRDQIVPQQGDAPVGLEAADFRLKEHELRTKLAGETEMVCLHALVIAALRRKDPPARATTLFFRLWSEHGGYLAGVLPARWLISAATTFADHGRNAQQTALGMGLSVMYDMVKLHDSERRLTGMPANVPFPKERGIKRPKLAFGMNQFSFRGGDVDRNMLARLWALAEEDPCMFPLAREMLQRAITDDRSIFARVQKLRATQAQEDIAAGIRPKLKKPR